MFYLLRAWLGELAWLSLSMTMVVGKPLPPVGLRFPIYELEGMTPALLPPWDE